MAYFPYPIRRQAMPGGGGRKGGLAQMPDPGRIWSQGFGGGKGSLPGA